jgi:hypothetical protein
MRALLWLGLGAAAMYLFDPDQGRRRRALVSDRMTKARQVIRERASGKMKDAGNHAQGIAHGTETPEGAHHLGR